MSILSKKLNCFENKKKYTEISNLFSIFSRIIELFWKSYVEFQCFFSYFFCYSNFNFFPIFFQKKKHFLFCKISKSLKKSFQVSSTNLSNTQKKSGGWIPFFFYRFQFFLVNAAMFFLAPCKKLTKSKNLFRGDKQTPL